MPLGTNGVLGRASRRLVVKRPLLVTGLGARSTVGWRVLARAGIAAAPVPTAQSSTCCLLVISKCLAGRWLKHWHLGQKAGRAMTKQGLGSGMWWTCGPAYLHRYFAPAHGSRPRRARARARKSRDPGGWASLAGCSLARRHWAVGRWASGNTFSHPLQPWTWAWA